MMDLNEFIGIFKESFDEVDQNISSSTRFKELEHWTSMQALLLIAHLDDTINIVLDAEDIKDAVTIDDLFKKALEK